MHPFIILLVTLRLLQTYSWFFSLEVDNETNNDDECSAELDLQSAPSTPSVRGEVVNERPTPIIKKPGKPVKLEMESI